MPKKIKVEAQEALQRKVMAGIEAMKVYLKLHNEEAIEALSRTLPEPEEKKDDIKPLTESPAVNQALATAYSWGRSGLTLFNTGMNYAHKNIIHNEALKQSRHALVTQCLSDLEGDESAEEKVGVLENLLFGNMALSLKFLGKEYIHSGRLHSHLCKALEISNLAADKLCATRENESEQLDTTCK
tara:strand:- start:388 stop:942 length:555 start_codon:yes stop_codon:yes gene_type:complete